MVLTHRYAQKTNGNLDSADIEENVLRATHDNPIPRLVCQGKTEHILENQEAGERFNSNVAYITSQQMIHRVESKSHRKDLR